MPKRKKWLIAIVIVIAVFCCSYIYLKNKFERHDVIVGGVPCKRDTTILPATIVAVEITPNNFVYIKVAFKTRDSVVHVFDLNAYYDHRAISKDEFVQSGIKEGDLVTCIHHTGLEGDCAPETFSFKLEKYRQ